MSADWDDADDGPDYDADALAARQWARDLLTRENWCVLDVETTGLHAEAEPVEIAAFSASGERLLETLILPHDGIVPRHVERIHGISTERLAAEGAPPFRVVYDRLREAVGDTLIVAYNAAFDRGILSYATRIADVGPSLLNEWACAMEWYAQYVGDWNDWHQSYRWQKLPHFGVSGAHGAAADCRAVLALIATMAQ